MTIAIQIEPRQSKESGSKRRLMPMLLLSLAAHSLSATGQPDDIGRFALGRISVIDGGYGIKETADGVILDRYFDARCEVPTEPKSATPLALAGSRGSGMTLDVRVLGCRRATAPAVRCDWSIMPKDTRDSSCGVTRGHSSGQASWQGWQGEVVLSLPEDTGSYELSLNCQLEDGDHRSEDRLKRDLFVTWAAPLVAFSPAEFEWFARAACWAAGLGAEHTEGDVVQAIRAGMYRYGNDHWRYGYAEKTGDTTYRFPLADNAAGKTAIEYQLTRDLGDLCYSSEKRCKCPWRTLVDSRALCKFGDCYVFSHALQAMAGVMGVGGLRPVMIKGEGNYGFLTRPRRSLDPMFPGNVRCGEGESCDFYYFGNHSLRLRDGQYHDATFNNVYASPEEPIAWHGTVSDFRQKENRSFPDSSKVWTVDGRGYGGWTFLRSGDAEIAPRSSSSDDVPLRFTGNVVIETEDPNTDGLVNRLAATVEVEILTGGEYLVQAGLFKGEAEVARLPGWAASGMAGGVVTGEAGKYRARLTFSGEEIFRSGLDGPYSLRAFVETPGGRVTFEKETRKFDHRDFGENAAMLEALEVEAVDADRDAPYEAVLVRVTLEARESTELALDLRLAKDRHTLGYGGAKEDLLAGRHTLEVEIPLKNLDPATIDGPLELTAILFDARLHAISELVSIVEDPRRLFD